MTTGRINQVATLSGGHASSLRWSHARQGTRKRVGVEWVCVLAACAPTTRANAGCVAFLESLPNVSQTRSTIRKTRLPRRRTGLSAGWIKALASSGRINQEVSGNHYRPSTD